MVVPPSLQGHYREVSPGQPDELFRDVSPSRTDGFSGSPQLTPTTALLSLSLGAQQEHKRLRERWSALHRDNCKLEHLLRNWQNAYRELEERHRETCRSLQLRVEELTQKLQEEKQGHLEEHHRLQQENASLREANAMLRRRQLDATEHSAIMYRQNQSLQEMLIRAQDQIKSVTEHPVHKSAGESEGEGQFKTLADLVESLEQSKDLMESELDDLRVAHVQVQHRNRLLELQLERQEGTAASGEKLTTWKEGRRRANTAEFGKENLASWNERRSRDAGEGSKSEFKAPAALPRASSAEFGKVANSNTNHLDQTHHGFSIATPDWDDDAATRDSNNDSEEWQSPSDASSIAVRSSLPYSLGHQPKVTNDGRGSTTSLRGSIGSPSAVLRPSERRGERPSKDSMKDESLSPDAQDFLRMLPDMSEPPASFLMHSGQNNSTKATSAGQSQFLFSPTPSFGQGTSAPSEALMVPDHHRFSFKADSVAEAETLTKPQSLVSWSLAKPEFADEAQRLDVSDRSWEKGQILAIPVRQVVDAYRGGESLRETRIAGC